MRIASYAVQDAQAPGVRVGAVVDRHLVDLNYAAARLFHEGGNARPRALADARVPAEMIAFLDGGPAATDDARAALDLVAELPAGARGIDGERLSYALDEVRLTAPIARPRKIFAAGKNYLDHVAEGGGGEVQPFPRGFVKTSCSVIGPDEPVRLPHVTSELDYEVELAVVIGKRGRYISAADAYDHVAGYTIINDISARDIQLAEARYGNHMIGKNLDDLAPMGPWIVLKDDVADPMDLELRMTVNGEERQHAHTGSMIHGIPALIERWSWQTLEPGDVIATGTPAGVALGGKFPYLKVGDVMVASIEGIGELRNEIVAEAVNEEHAR